MGQILTALSNAISGTKSPNPLSTFNVPHRTATTVGGDIAETAATVSDWAREVTEAAGDIAQVVNTAYCIGLAITNPSMLLGVLDIIGNSVMSVVLDMVDRILTVLEGQIMQMFNNIAGTIINVFNAILSVLNAILDIYDALCKIYDFLTEDAWNTRMKFMSKDDCEFMLASMALCILNKLFGEKLAQFEKDITGEIVEWGQEWNTKITNELADTNNIANFVQQESFMVSKSAQQLGMIFGG